MKKNIVSLFCVLALCLGLLPTAALAAGEDVPDNLYVGNQQVIVADTITYWTTDDSGGLDESTENANWNVKYDPNTATLTLNGATITGNSEDASASKGAGIYALSRSGQPVSLTIELIGENTITGTYGIYVDSELSENSHGTDASLIITGESNGSLKVSGSYYGIYVKSGTGDASLNINDASVVAKSTQTYSGSAGVYVQSSARATSSPQLSLAVNGGTLTASGGTSSDGIQFYMGDPNATNATTSLTISDNAIVRAENGIKAYRVDEPTPSGTGIVFNGKKGTVYGDVTLDDPLTVDKGETLTIPQGSTLNGTNLTNKGTVTIENGGELTGGDAINNTDGTINVEKGGTMTGDPAGGTVVYKVTGVTLDKDTLPLFTGDSAPLKATITPANATNQNLTWTSSAADVVTVTADQQDGTKATVQALKAGTATITVESEDGGFTDSCTVTVTDKTYTLSADQTALDFGAAYPGYTQPAAQTVTVTNTGNQTVTLNQPTATNFQVGALTVTSLAPNGTATFTVQPKAALAVGQYAEELTVNNQNGGEVKLTVTFTVNPVPVTGVTLDKNTLALFAGDSANLAATVAPANATNKAVTWSTSNAAVATVDATGKVTAVAPGTAAITVTTQDGAKTAACAVTVTAKTYSMSIDPGAIGFGNVQVGYTQPAVREITVKNTGNQTLTLTQPTATNYQVGSLNQFTVAPGDTAIFTVQPKAGLLSGSYNETVVVSAAGAQSVSVNLTFTVGSPASSGTTTEKRTLHFNTNGGLAMDDVVRGLGAPVELWPYTPVRAGYLFQGWYADQALTQAVSSVVLTKDTTVYAKWAVDPAAAAAQSSSSGSGSSSSSGKGSGSKGGTTVTVTPAPTASPTPTPTPTATPTPEPTATPEASAEPETDADAASFPVVPVAAGVIVLVVLVGGIAIYRRFHD